MCGAQGMGGGGTESLEVRHQVEACAGQGVGAGERRVWPRAFTGGTGEAGRAGCRIGQFESSQRRGLQVWSSSSASAVLWGVETVFRTAEADERGWVDLDGLVCVPKSSLRGAAPPLDQRSPPPPKLHKTQKQRTGPLSFCAQRVSPGVLAVPALMFSAGNSVLQKSQVCL